MRFSIGWGFRCQSESLPSKFFANECLGVFMELDKDFSEFVALFIDHDVCDDLIANKRRRDVRKTLPTFSV